MRIRSRRSRRSVGNAAIAAVTALALCSGAWLLRNGTETHAPPQPSAAQAGESAGARKGADGRTHAGTRETAADEAPEAGQSAAPALPPPLPTTSASPRSASPLPSWAWV